MWGVFIGSSFSNSSDLDPYLRLLDVIVVVTRVHPALPLHDDCEVAELMFHGHWSCLSIIFAEPARDSLVGKREDEWIGDGFCGFGVVVLGSVLGAMFRELVVRGFEDLGSKELWELILDGNKGFVFVSVVFCLPVVFRGAGIFLHPLQFAV